MLDFLDTPKRSQKPRNIGITHVIDRGIGIRQAQDLIETSGYLIDFLKLGWCTGYVTENLTEKISLYQDSNLPVYFGGTLFEVAILQNKFDAFRRMLTHYKITHVEVSTGIIELSLDEKVRYIEALAQDFIVLSEVGRKDESKRLDPLVWVEAIMAELEAGAWKVITESRESGTAGICNSGGQIKSDLITEITTQINHESLIFEAPNKAQQLWFIQQFGHAVNLGNISVDDVIALETLRLGLRSDTIGMIFDSSMAARDQTGAALNNFIHSDLSVS
mgnify:CR=1 FL=1